MKKTTEYKNIFGYLDYNEIIEDILPNWFYEKYMKNRCFDNYETGRE